MDRRAKSRVGHALAGLALALVAASPVVLVSGLPGRALAADRSM